MDASDVMAGRLPGIEDFINQSVRALETGGELPDPGGLGALLKSTTDQQREIVDRQARLITNVLYDDERGREVLELLLDMTLRKPAWPAWAYDNAEMLKLQGIGREYQNELVREVLRVIAGELDARRRKSGTTDGDDDE